MSQSSQCDIGLPKGSEKELHEFSKEITLTSPIREATRVRTANPQLRMIKSLTLPILRPYIWSFLVRVAADAPVSFLS